MPSAGEVEQFAYCPHNWLLARQGHDPHGEASRRGDREHLEKGAAFARAEAQRQRRHEGLRWSFLVLAAAGSATFLTLELIYLRATPLHWVFLTTALVLTSASAGMLTLGLHAERRMRREQRRNALVPGRLVASDLQGEAPLLKDPETGLQGRPDTVLETAHGLVPVEVKTGSTPQRPYESHVLQLACYLRLLEANGQTPEYGLLNYPDGVFRVAYDADLKARLHEVLERIQEAEETGRADRDHQHAARCRGCARREACGQRLDAQTP